MAIPVERIRHKLEIERLKKENEQLRKALYEAEGIVNKLYVRVHELKEKAYGEHARKPRKEESSRNA